MVFVAIVGAFPSVTLATIAAFRQVPPLLTARRHDARRATGWQLYRSVIFPAALPGYVAGLQQAWGFAWKSLMAGELIVDRRAGDGTGAAPGREPGATCPRCSRRVAVIVVIGVAVDYLVFNQLDRRIRARRGLLVEG